MASYWQKYGLTSDPFVDDGLSGEPFFPSRWHQQLDLLRHLSRNSNMVLLVTGISGMGKTTFMEILFDQIESKSGVCKVHGSSGVTPDVLQELIIRHIGMPTTGTPEANFQQRFLQQTERMDQAKDDFYLVIDNAHRLPKSSLAFLVDIAEWQSSEIHPLHLILFGGPQLDAMMAEITAQHLGEAMTHTIRIEPFSLEMTKEYIFHRLTQAGFQGDLPLSELQINQIHQASNGIPAKINLIARQVLLDSDPKNNKRKPVKPVNPTTNYREAHKSTSAFALSKWFLIGSVAVIGVILAVVFYFRTPATLNQTAEVLSLPNQAAPAAITATNDAVPATAPDNSIQADMDEDQTQTEGLNGMVATAKTVQPPKPVTTTNTDASADDADSDQSSAPVDDSVDTSTAAVNTTPAVADNAQATVATASPAATSGSWVPLTSAQAKTANTSDEAAAVNTDISTAATPEQPSNTSSAVTPTVAAAPEVAVVKPISTPKAQPKMVTSASLVHDEQALMVADPARITLQIAAANNYSGLKSFIKAAGLDGQVYFFRTVNAGNPWFVAVYGDYVDTTAAKQAIATLPAVLKQKEQPWPRSFGSVQKAIKMKQ